MFTLTVQLPYLYCMTKDRFSDSRNTVRLLKSHRARQAIRQSAKCETASKAAVVEMVSSWTVKGKVK